MAIFDRSLFVAAAGLSAAFAQPAHATWSILIADMRTGEIVIGSATCVELIDLQQETPVLISGVGAVTAQSAVDNSGLNRQLIRDRLLQGVPLDAILEELSMTDNGHGNRQYGMIDTFGDTLTYSGIENAAWAGGLTGRLERGVPGPQEDIVFTVQGNILSGGNVVQAAIDAIEMSSGDLPAMMMEAMIAAKNAGGDGRCSCSNANPTGCGSPPPAPFKSAHVGYMLGTRAGDRDATRAIYPIDGFVGAIETIDLDGDGFEEVIVGNRDTNEISIYRNTSSEGVPLSSLELWQTIEAPASGVVAMGVGDFDEDGAEELAVAHTSPPTLSIYEIEGLDGSGMSPTTFDLIGTPVDLDIGNTFSSSYEIAVAMDDSHAIAFIGYHDSEYMYIDELIELNFSPSSVRLSSVGNNSLERFVVADPNSNRVLIYRHNGEFSFDPPILIDTLTNPVGLETADMDNDGDNELLVQTGTGRQVQIFEDIDSVWSLWGQANAAGIGIGFDVGDMNGDGFPDVVSTVQATNRNLRLNISDGLGGFALQTRTRVGASARSVLLRDMNNNGELDIVVGHQGEEGLAVLDNPGDGQLPQPRRFADGEYFMSLNIPNQRAADVDPVDQLQNLYDEWRLGRVGHVDAVRSSVSGYGVLTLGSSEVFTIELRDLHGNLLDITDPSELQVEVRDSFAAAGQPVLIEPGVFEIELIGGDEIGQSRLVVHAGVGEDAVRLMPDFSISVSASLADFNADGMCNFFDVSAYLAAYFSGDIRADIDRDGCINFRDASAFLQSYNACSGG